MNRETPESHPLDDHPGLDNDEATTEGKMMTAEGSIGGDPDSEGDQTLEEHPGLDNDEATEEGKLMTAEGSVGPSSREDDHA